jgi:Carboxypeptidase regulatory-like domain
LRQIVVVAIVTLLFAGRAAAQSPNGTISGTVFDPGGNVIAGAAITVVNDATRVQSYTKTNSDGVYVLPNLAPGSYRLQVAKDGFKTLIKPDIVLNVQDALAINFTLPVGAISETVTVQGGAPLVNSESASVSTVIDRTFVANLPLNGRSFNTLLQLTPGVVIAPSTFSSPGQFNIAGQRSDANSFSVDGVSANFGVSPAAGPGGSGIGATQAFSALGGTSSLVSVDALQEFRIETSSFAPEFGRTPGGQVILTTRSGTNDFHGGVFDYFRNTVLDANDWFLNNAGLPRAAEEHNDFGGFLGGPIQRNKTFFFFSYEGARLRQPDTEDQQVPSLYARSAAPASLAPFLNAYPLPNGMPVSPTSYTAPFTGGYSNPGTLNATSIRVDHNFGDRFSLFGRYNYAPSHIQTLSEAAEFETTAVNTQTLTVGLNMALSQRLANALRGNFSSQTSTLNTFLGTLGGAVVPEPSLFLGSLPSANNLFAFQTPDVGGYASGPGGRNQTRQFNLLDDLSATVGTHELKFGGDYRAIFLDVNPHEYSIAYLGSSVQGFLATGTATLSNSVAKQAKLLMQAFSLYGQDTWKATSRLTLTYGIRWELNPAPEARGQTTLASFSNVDNPSELALSPPGTSVWNTTFRNFAPRIGIAYALTHKGDLILRASAGVFYDLGLGISSELASLFPNGASNFQGGVAIPVIDLTPYLPTISITPPIESEVLAFSSSLKLPRSYQWNLALEKSFGKQAVSATYVGQAGRDLLRVEGLYQPNPDFESLAFITGNGAYSNYDALQLQYRRPLSSRLQALVNYTWSHSLDNASNDAVAGPSNTIISAASDYASSNFDARNSFSGAVSYLIPGLRGSRFMNVLTNDWSVDSVLVARSGFPFNALVDLGGALSAVNSRPDLVPGQPLWIAAPSAPGGQILDVNAFSVPSTVRQGTEGRNDIPGFGLTQMDLSLARKFPIHDRLNLQFRADAFNLLNHPNFANPIAYIQYGPAYLESQNMLNQGLGGLNPLFQEGGPRSIQFSLKLTF